MAPGINRARLHLAKFYEQHLGQPAKAAALREEVGRQAATHIITVVSGLPRSGTSMMMQALVAAGLTAFADDQRAADDNDPKGYLEHAAVKGLARDARFLELETGQVVKVVAPLLPYLPPRYHYKVIFMDRGLDEVIGSQRRMLAREGKVDKAKTYPLGLHEALAEQLRKAEHWHLLSPNVELLRAPYREVIEDPRSAMARVDSFLGHALDVDAMAAAVDPRLYRERHVRLPPAERCGSCQRW